jgi:cyclophilin family peptidyl-prolyl cis-trans isomerase
MLSWTRLLQNVSSRFRLPNSASRGKRVRRRHLPYAVACEALESRFLLAALVSTDQATYAPGDTVVISGTGFTPGETVELQVLHADSTHASDPNHQPFQVQDGGAGDLDGVADGNILVNWVVGAGEGNSATFNVTATGLTSAETDDTSFTVVSFIGSVTVGGQTGALTYGTAGSATYTITVERGIGAVGAFVADLSLTTALPTGATFAFDSSSLSFGAGDNSLSTTLTITTTAATPATVPTLAFTVQAQVDSNASDLATDEGPLNVQRKVLTGSITAADKVFDGTTAATITGRTLDGVISGDDVAYDGGTAAFDTAATGNGKTVTATGLGLAGADAANYTVNDTAVTTAAIEATFVSSVTVGAQNGTLTYGTAGSATYTVTVERRAGMTGAFVVDLDLSTVLPAGATFAFTDATLSFGAGDDSLSTTLTITTAANTPATVPALALTVEARVNSSTSDVARGDGALAVARKVLTGSITAADKPFDSTTSATITSRDLVGVVNGDDVSYVGGTATFASEAVGNNHTVTATGLSLAGADAANYTVNSTAVTTASITKSLSINSLVSSDLPQTKVEYIPVSVSNGSTDPVIISVQSSSPNVTATVLSGGRSLRFTVSGVDANGIGFTGDIVFRLFENEAPITTARIIELVNSNFYNGLLFHRVIQNFVAQGGDPLGTGAGGSGTKFSDEFNFELTFTSRGLLAMANSGDDTNDSQFFITSLDLPMTALPQHLNFQHTIFGVMTGGFDVFRKLISTPTDANNKPLTNAVINAVTVFTDDQNGVIKVMSSNGFTGSATITVTADSGQGNVDIQQTTFNVVSDSVQDPAFLGAVSNQVTNQGVPVTFNVQGFDLEGDNLTFVVKDAASFAGADSTGTDPANIAVNIVVTPASGSTPATAAITLTPSITFSGTVNLIVGVRDQTHRFGTSINSRANFDTQAITLTVNAVNHAPTTTAGTTNLQFNTSATIQLIADDGDPDKTQVLTFEIIAQPANGTITNFNASTGSLTYTPNNNFLGTDTFTYRVLDDGGTDNGGQNTSAVTTHTINVGAPPPTNLALTAASDDGLFNDDRVFSNTSPVFTVSAHPGSLVKLIVNGVSEVIATETSSGQYSAMLSRQNLRVGVNSIVATATINSVTSLPSTALDVTYTPSYESIYTVPGDFGTAQQLTIQWTAKNAAFKNEIGYFFVDDLDGRVNGLLPGDPGYAAAALSSASRRVMFASGAGAGATMTTDVTGGQLLQFYLVSNSTTANLLKNNPQNLPTGLNVFFATENANPGKVDHVKVTFDAHTGRVLMHWEDMLFGGDRDYNDAVITITPVAMPSSTVGETLRIPGGPNHQVPVTFTLTPTQKSRGGLPASFATGEIGIFIVSDPSGRINGILPGSAGYLQAALGSASRQVLFNMGDPLGTQRTIMVPGGSLISWYFTPGTTAANVLAVNVNNSPSNPAYALFALDAANPDGREHFRWYGPESTPIPDTGSELNLHILDRLFGDPKEFDDLMLSISLGS